MGQDPLVSTEAGKFAIWLIPAIFPYAILQLLIRYLQTQSLILPMLLSSLASLFVNLSLCRVFVFKLKLGNGGAAVSIGLSYWLNVIVLGVYVKYSSALFSKEVFSCLGEFFRYPIPSAIMLLVGSGVARGGGWQGIGGYVNLGAYYAVGIPVALVMGFVMHLKGEGLWIGLVAGTGVQCFLFSLVTSLIDWDKQAREARQRIFEGRFPAQIELI
ncbi:hypothetical protein BUALT_Bualt11G0058600 [Buddleja alternifolia]|uniref:Uncharacterized protein n=1 Tax=Buddleja alternifolia TaxID=168488 RepID=A0AAV6X0W2_9LAMI|nr:hypothetical protein BUALT_Bualt11G0058600 [Buddleja alternifolia]